VSFAGNLSLPAIAVFVGVLVLFGALALAGAGDPNRARLQRRLRRVGFAAGSAGAADVAAKLRRQDGANEGVERLLERILPRRQALADRLARTGLKIPVYTYVLVVVGLAGVLTVVVRIMFGLPVPLALLAGLAVGFLLPHMVIGSLAKRRLAKFLKLFPDTLDLMVRTVRSGLPIAEAVDLAGNDMAEPVRGEFRRVSDNMRIGRTLEEALWETADRLNLPEFKFFMVSLSVQRETGGNIAETLANLSQLLRRRQQMKLKIKSLSAEARASAWIVGALPVGMFGVLYMVNTEYMAAMLDDPRGLVLIGFGILSEVVGVGIMIKMSKFEI